MEKKKSVSYVAMKFNYFDRSQFCPYKSFSTNLEISKNPILSCHISFIFYFRCLLSIILAIEI